MICTKFKICKAKKERKKIWVEIQHGGKEQETLDKTVRGRIESDAKNRKESNLCTIVNDYNKKK